MTAYAAFILGVFLSLGFVTVGSVVAELRQRVADRHTQEDLDDYEVFESGVRP